MIVNKNVFSMSLNKLSKQTNKAMIKFRDDKKKEKQAIRFPHPHPSKERKKETKKKKKKKRCCPVYENILNVLVC